jgi:hypothetical protein
MAATKQEKAFYVLDYAQCKSVTTVQRNPRTRFGKDPANRKSIHDWYCKLETTACLAKQEPCPSPCFRAERAANSKSVPA